MKYLLWLLKAAIFFTLFAFALNNQQDATVHFFFGTQWRAPLVLVVLAVTLVARHLLHSLHTSSADVFGEGLLIVGWVGLWRPAEMLLFDRLESAADRAVLRRLSQIPVHFRAQAG